MDWRGVENYDQMSEWGADAIFQAMASRLAEGKRFNLGLATGNTMIGLYRLLAEKLNRERIDLRHLHTYNLDEYVGPDGRSVPADHPLSYRGYMHQNLFSALDAALGFAESQAHFPDPVDPAAFDRELEAAGGLDFQLLGIGFNGHIAFNEPIPESEISAADFAALPSRTVALKELTIQTNSRLTAGDDDALVPRQAATMGMRQILAAKEILLLACFPEQVTPLGQMLADLRPTPELPASYLVDHPDATIVYTRDVISLDLP
jgi:glucosamine-6-phosphate deaminase